MNRTDPAGRDDVPARFLVDFTGQTLLGQYRVERRLAEGGMGSVYLAEDENLGRRVVVKVPHTRFLGDAGFRARFRREIEELVRLEHPHVVRILARGEQDGIPFFVLQFLGGGSLEDRLARGAESPAQALAWLGTIADTLDFLHGRGVIHRDVKPANILFDESGHVFLSDFGVVKALGTDDGADLTAVGTGVGSPLYMAPEQGMGHGVTPASDQYALASALYEALAGAPPFGRGSVVEILVRKGREDAAPLRRTLPDLPEACEAAVARALAREPLQRFATCAEFAAAFRAGLAPAPAVAAPRSRLPLVALLAGLPVLVVVGVLTRGFGLWAERPPAPPAVARAAPPPAEPMILVRLNSAGAEPRQLLRWRFTPGRKQAWRTHTTAKQTMKFEMKTGPAPAPAMEFSGDSEQDMDVVVTEVDAEGRARLAWTFHPEKPLPGSAPNEWGAMQQKIAEALGTLSGTSLITRTGVSLEATLHSERVLDAEARRYLTGTEETMRNMSMRLPDDPVGVGARWETTQIKELLTIRYQEVASYEVLSRTGDRLRVKFEFSADAPDQPFVPIQGRGGGKEKARILEFKFQGQGEALVDLAEVVPIESTVRADIVHVMEGEDKEGAGTVRFTRTFEARTTPR
jgi:hypothetical protein